MTSRLRCTLSGLLLVPLWGAHDGGWATITVDELPDYIVVGRQVDLRFMLRQHGETPLSGRSPVLLASSGGTKVRMAATPTRTKGEYRVAFSVNEPGAWSITIDADFGDSRVTLLPIDAVSPGPNALAAFTQAERGERLFVAKGCISCHLHREIDGSGQYAVGPELTGTQLPADYLQAFLANPSIRPPSLAGEPMPNLDLDPQETAALAAFLTSAQPRRR